MKVLIIGCGAVGLSLASALYASDVETHLVVSGETATAIRQNGIKRRGILGDTVIAPEKIRMFDTVEKAESGYDYIINSAKATANNEIANNLALGLRDILGNDGHIVLFQNGYGNEKAFAEIYNTEQIYHASFAIGFKRPERYISEVTVILSPVSIGSIFGFPADRCQGLAKAIDGGGIPCVLTDEIDKTLWAKLLYNCTLNPLSAILKTNYGGLIKSESSVSLMKEIIDEVFAVMRASGHETFWQDADSYIKEFFDKILPPTYEHRSSTLQDIERKIPTEIDSLNGAVVTMGDVYKMDTPCNWVITQIIKSIEAQYDDIG